MPRSGLTTLSDIDGKLDWLRIECAKCGRFGRYRVAKLIAKHGPEETLQAIRAPPIEGCPRQIKRDYNDLCGARFPDLITVL